MQGNQINQLRRFKKRNSQSSDDEQELNMSISIIGNQNGSCNQMAIVYLTPFTMIWYKGQILSSSHGEARQRQREQLVHMLSDSMKLGTQAPRSLQNLTSETCYYIIKKEAGNDGKILILNEIVYEENFYIDFSRLLTINLDVHEYQSEKHNELRHLRSLFPLKNIPVPCVCSLQSTRDSTIIEKYLAPNQKLYLPNAKVIAMSSKVKVTRSEKTKQLSFIGPGFVFFEASSKISVHPKLYEYFTILVFVALLIFAIDMI